MIEKAIDGNKERDILITKRNRLFARLVKTPQDTCLALEIKTIDDQVAQYTAQMRRKAPPRPKPRL